MPLLFEEKKPNPAPDERIIPGLRKWAELGIMGREKRLSMG